MGTRYDGPGIHRPATAQCLGCRCELGLGTIEVLVLFDIDDTLIDHSGAFLAGTTALHVKLKSNLPIGEFLALAAAVHRRDFDRFLAGELTYVEQGRSRVRALVGHDLEDDEADQLFAHYITEYEAAWTLYPDVLACLQGLSHHRLGVISNGRLVQQRKKLEKLGIVDKFESVTISEEAGFYKPQPGIFHHACSASRQPTNQAVYVGDLYDVDTLGARSAGLNGIWLDRSKKATTVHVPPIINSLDELPDIIDALEHGRTSSEK